MVPPAPRTEPRSGPKTLHAAPSSVPAYTLPAHGTGIAALAEASRATFLAPRTASDGTDPKGRTGDLWVVEVPNAVLFEHGRRCHAFGADPRSHAPHPPLHNRCRTRCSSARRAGAHTLSTWPSKCRRHAPSPPRAGRMRARSASLRCVTWSPHLAPLPHSHTARLHPGATVAAVGKGYVPRDPTSHAPHPHIRR